MWQIYRLHVGHMAYSAELVIVTGEGPNPLWYAGIGSKLWAAQGREEDQLHTTGR